QVPLAGVAECGGDLRGVLGEQDGGGGAHGRVRGAELTVAAVSGQDDLVLQLGGGHRCPRIWLTCSRTAGTTSAANTSNWACWSVIAQKTNVSKPSSTTRAVGVSGQARTARISPWLPREGRVAPSAL